MHKGHEGGKQDLQNPGSGFFGTISFLDLTESSYSITVLEYEAVARRVVFCLGGSQMAETRTKMHCQS